MSKPMVTLDFGYAVLPVAVLVKYDRCLSCGLIFQNPRMSDDSVGAYYSEGHYRKYMEGMDVDGDEMSRSIRIAKELGRAPTRHLDIGCSRGYLLNATREAFNCGIQGVDENPGYAVEGIPVVDSLKLLVGDFDLITMIHVLEHVTDPLETLTSLKPYLRKGGTLLIEVPSMTSKGGPWRLAHLYHFEPWVLHNLCKTAGYEVKNVRISEHTQIEVTVA